MLIRLFLRQFEYLFWTINMTVIDKNRDSNLTDTYPARLQV